MKPCYDTIFIPKLDCKITVHSHGDHLYLPVDEFKRLRGDPTADSVIEVKHDGHTFRIDPLSLMYPELIRKNYGIDYFGCEAPIYKTLEKERQAV